MKTSIYASKAHLNQIQTQKPQASAQRGGLKTWRRLISFALSLTSILALTTGCAKSGDHGAVVATPPVLFPSGLPGGVPSCGGCPGAPRFITSVLSRGVSGYGAPIEMGLDIFGDQNLAMQSAYTIGSYFGPFAATGYLFLQGGLPECGIPAGRFILQTQQAGNWGNDGAGRAGENLMLVMVGAPIPMNVFLSGFTMPLTPAGQGVDGRMYPFSFTTSTMLLKRADTAATCTLLLQ